MGKQKVASIKTGGPVREEGLRERNIRKLREDGLSKQEALLMYESLYQQAQKLIDEFQKELRQREAKKVQATRMPKQIAKRMAPGIAR